ncbi:GNAT family N-acetyltransferase [Phenylobacterium aquaticum]|uniref:GNAT family N-acetyltransferase n=1 Tax=Phenylobacterium aquaticum TaxID=1763816 RepID=UPI0026F2C2B4|nr:GNAT family N-acetyltransferase [Phenylobacterium aquaticum]
MNITNFRPATAADLPAIIALLADDALGAGREDLTDLEIYAAAFARLDTNTLLAVADMDGQVRATLQMTVIQSLSNRGGRFALLQAVRVDSGLRGQGVGAAFIAWAMDEARARGCSAIELFTHESREAAQRFYARLGFAPSHVGMRRTL